MIIGTTIREAQAALAKGTVSPKDLTRMALKRIRRVQPRLNAATEVLEERAYKTLESMEAASECSSYSSPMRGIPVGVKDNFCLAGTTCGSEMLRPFKATYDATGKSRSLSKSPHSSLSFHLTHRLSLCFQ